MTSTPHTCLSIQFCKYFFVIYYIGKNISNCTVENAQYALQGQKHYNTMSQLRFCPCECIHVVITQSDALSYELLDLQPVSTVQFAFISIIIK